MRSSRPPPPRLSSALKLSGMDFDLMNASRRILEGALGVVPGEKVVVVVDAARRDLGASLVDAAETAGARTNLLVLEDLATRPIRRLPTELEAELSNAQASLVLASFDDGELAMRYDLISLVRHLNLRHGHMLGITRKSMIAGFSVDQARILDATRAVRTRLRPDSVLRVRSSAGTDLEVRLSPLHRWAEHVGVIRPGRWENLPSGELVTSPASVTGTYVADASVGTQLGATFGLLEKTPVRFEIEQSHCRSVRAPDMTLERHILEFMRREHNLDRVGLVILGTNVGIHAPTGEVFCDQNRPGLHLAFGSTFPEQTGATWTTRAQILVTAANANVDLDGMPLVRSGRCIV
jgi:aminopeptidase